MASSAPPQPPPRITIYRNGDKHFSGRKFVVNRKYYRSFENFLDKVTSDTQSRFAIRKIHTPMGGTRIGSLEMIQNGAVYVAAGSERFQRVKYGVDPLKTTSSSPSSIQPVTHSKINAVSRYKQEAMAEPLRNRIIFVYRNGEEKTAPVKLLLDKRTLRSLDAVLQYISNKVNMTSGSVKSIHSMDSGAKVSDISEIKTNTSYIAVGSGKHFHKRQIFNESKSNKTISRSPRDKGKLENKNKNKVRDLVSSSLSLPDQGLTSGIIALSDEIEENMKQNDGDTDLNVSGKSIVHSVIDRTEDAVSNVEHLRTSPVVDDGHIEPADEIIPEISAAMSGTPPVTDETNVPATPEIMPDVSADISGTPPLTDSNEYINSTIENSVDSNIEEYDDDSGELITITTEETDEKEQESPRATVDIVSEELANTLHIDSSAKEEDIETEKVSDEEDVADVPMEDESVTKEDAEEAPGVYKASGLQQESGDQIGDDKETTVEKTLDMVAASEVEEDLENLTETELQHEDSKFYT